ncbi:MAG: nucleotidyltransferase, partial [Candidatus Bipolaricaulota bacterium]
EFFLPAVVADLIAERGARVRVLPTTEEWMGVTYREDIPGVTEGIRALIEGGIYPDKLWEDAP